MIMICRCCRHWCWCLCLWTVAFWSRFKDQIMVLTSLTSPLWVIAHDELVWWPSGYKIGEKVQHRMAKNFAN